jgi:hypothetical protein
MWRIEMFKSTQIFISYRRSSGAGYAGRLAQSLKKDFKVFFDTSSIEYGKKFDEHIEEGLKSSTVVLAILDDRSVEEFKKRENQDDFVLFELETAYANKIPIIPILMNNAPMPTQEELPASLSFLPFLNAFGLRHERFTDDTEVLIREISETYGNNRFIRRFKVCCIALMIALLLFAFKVPVSSFLTDRNITGQSISSFFSIGNTNINYSNSNFLEEE